MAFGTSTKILTLFVSLSAHAAFAQTNDTIVVMDVSGSMWGQIEGRTKIEIARDAFADMATDWTSQGLQPGLIAYGHRRKGDCRDIELLAAPGTNSADTIAGLVNTLTPRGKTPLSDAVRLAAEELKFTENTANVILLSDGRETCDANPCAVSQELEALGINFTAHVIGFDIIDDEARDQLQCIAANTGGQYFDADSSERIGEALREVAIIERPADPEPATDTIVAFTIQIDEQDGASRLDQASIRATDMITGDVVVLGYLKAADQILAGLNANLPEGQWKIEVLSAEGRGEVETLITPDTQVVSVPFSASEVTFRIADTGPYQLGVKHQFYLNVVGSLQPNATYTVSLFPANAVEFKERLDWESRFGSNATGMTLHDFTSPEAAGDYEILITQSYDLSEAIARFPITYVERAAATWQGVTHGEVGEPISIVLGGNTGRNGELTLTQDGAIATSYDMRSKFGPEGPMLPLPSTSGIYDLQYEYRLADGSAETATIAQITVGNDIRADDPDAVDFPADTDAALSADEHGWEPQDTVEIADKALSRLSERSDFVTVCRSLTCQYSNADSGLTDIPLIGDFGLLEPYLTDAGRPSIEIINEWTGEWVALNPIRQSDQISSCVDIGMNGPAATTPDTAIDLLCVVNGARGYTVQMMEALGIWAADRNAAGTLQGEAADTMMSPEEAGAEAAAIAQANPFAPILRTWTVINPDNIFPVGLINISYNQDEKLTGSLLIQNGSDLGLEEQEIEIDTVDVVYDDTGKIALITLTLPVLGTVQLIKDDVTDPNNPAFQGVLLNPTKGRVLNVKVL